MILGWWRRRRRRRLTATPWPEAWEGFVREAVWPFDQLTADQRAAIRETVRVLVAEKRWEGCAGFVVTDRVRVAIAAQVGWMMLGRHPFYFDAVRSILVYPDAFSMPRATPVGWDLHIHEREELHGVAQARDAVALSWTEVAAAGRSAHDGHHLVVHEFAHQLDMLGGSDIEGTPPMESAAQREEWDDVIDASFERLRRVCRRDRHPLLDCYGATERSEFFAVASEVFFQRPTDLAREWPDLHRVLATFYRLRPTYRAAEPFFG